MNKTIFFILLFYVQLGFATELLYISLGSNCEPASRLNECQLRLAAYPFDWLISPFDALYETLEEDFSKFFTDLELLPDASGVTDYYGHKFIHDWRIPTHPSVDLTEVDWVPNNVILGDWELAVPLIQEKYKRRIERLRNNLDGWREVVFIRYGDVDKTKAIKLRDLIREKYSNLKFILVVVKVDDEFIDPWNIEGIKNFSFEGSAFDRWKEVFKQLALEFDQ